MRRNMLMLLLTLGIAVAGRAEVSTSETVPDSEQKPGGTSAKSEKDVYLDLNTGKSFRFIYDELNDKYERDDLFAVDLYVNTRTRDSFWLDQAVPVNNALLRDATGIFKVNPMKVKRDGQGYKVINNKAVIKQEIAGQEEKPKTDTGSTM